MESIKVIKDGLLIKKDILKKYKISSNEYMVIYSDNQLIIHAVEQEDENNDMLYCYECDIFKYNKKSYDFESNIIDIKNYIKLKDAENIAISYNNDDTNYIEIRLVNDTYLNIEFSDNDQINNIKLSKESIVQAKYNNSKSNLETIFGFSLAYHLFINNNFIK